MKQIQPNLWKQYNTQDTNKQSKIRHFFILQRAHTEVTMVYIRDETEMATRLVAKPECRQTAPGANPDEVMYFIPTVILPF